jgi:LPXTG-motif cell wall-anchored protein
MMRLGVRIFFITATAVCLLTFAVTAVLAHAVELLESIPANGDLLAESPPTVMARFSEELVSSESSMIVVNAQGVQVDNGDGGVDLNDPEHAAMIVSLPPLPDGVYTVEWHATLLDGDVTDDAFAFTVGEAPVVIPNDAPTEAVEAAEAAETGLSTGTIIAIVVGLMLLLAGGTRILRRRQA